MGTAVAAGRPVDRLAPGRAGRLLDESGEALLVVVVGRVGPDLIRNRVGPVTEPSGGLGERQRGPFGIAEVRRLPPGCEGPEPLVGLTCLLAARAPASTQALQPLIWLARR